MSFTNPHPECCRGCRVELTEELPAKEKPVQITMISKFQ